MFQRMKNSVTVNVDGADLATVTGIEVYLFQEQTGAELLITGTDVIVVENTISFLLTKDFCMQLDVSPVRAQIMFTRDSGLPDATKPFLIPVSELMKEDGYGS